MHDRQRNAERRSRSAPATEPLEPRLLLSAAQLLKEINLSSNATYANFLSINNTAYFTVDTDAHGTELWKTDGTPSGTTLVKDIEPGTGSSSPSFPTNVNGTLYFTARTTAHGAELWKSDGTEAGTVMVADISPGSANGRSGVGGMIALGNTLLFSGSAGSGDGVELWAYDTATSAAAPRQVKDIAAGPSSGSGPADFRRAGNWVYFAATTNETGRELWRTDGTEAGTALVHNVRPFSASSHPRPLAALGNQLVFTADDGTRGDELWITDDTPTGAHLVKDIRTGGSGAGINHWAVVNNRLFFNAYDGTTLGDELYVTDGTAVGTTLLKDLYPNNGNGAPSDFVVFGDLLYFQSNGSGGRGLMKSDGTATGTGWVSGVGVGGRPLGVSRNTLYVASGGSAFDAGDLWKIPAPGAGPVLVRDNVTVTAAPVAVPEADVFPANDGGGPQLWVAGIATPGARPLLRTRPYGAASADPRTFVPFGDRYVFSADDGAHGAEPWITDGTPAGTFLLKDLNPGSEDGQTSLTGATLNGTFYFNGNNGSSGYELWKTDATTAGTTMVKDIRAGSAASNPSKFVVYNGKLYFITLLSNNQNDIWRSDGTAAGTVRLADSVANVPSGYINQLRVIGNNLYVRTEFAGVADWYRFNGTNFLNLTPNLPYAYDLKDAGDGHVYVHAQDTKSRLYKVNPANAANVPLTPDTFFVNSLWGSLGSSFYFVAQSNATGPELWVTDGTEAGTAMVAEPFAGYQSNAPSNPFFHANCLYFTAQSDTGWSLFVIPSAGALPTRVLDLAPSTAWDLKVAYGDHAGALHFSVNASGATGSAALGKLWRINPTTGAAEVAEENFAHPDMSDNRPPQGFLPVPGGLIFALKTDQHGTELYRYPALADTQPPTVTASAFLPWSSNQTVYITFDEPLAGPPDPAALQLANLTTGQNFAASAATWNAFTRTLAFTTVAPLPNGDYRATLAAGSVTDAAGNPLAAPHALTFTLLRGDANGDRTVNFADLLALAKNYNGSGKTTADGDFNGDGLVNFADLLALARNYNTTLLTPTPITPPLSPQASALSAKPKPVPAVFSTTPVAPKPKPTPPARRPAPRR